MSTKAVIFDLGGVLVGYDHSKSTQAIAEMSHANAATVNQLFHMFIDDLEVGKMTLTDFYAFYAKHIALTGRFSQFTEAFCAGLSRIEEGLAYAMQLKGKVQRIKLGAISNTYGGHAEWLDKNIPELKQFGVVLMSNRIGIAKPYPEIYLQALYKLGVAPQDGLFIDDVDRNVGGARNVGMEAILHKDWNTTLPKIEKWIDSDVC